MLCSNLNPHPLSAQLSIYHKKVVLATLLSVPYYVVL